MRVLFTTSPGIGHLFPGISTAWALRARGHEVLLATSGQLDAATSTGLPIVDVAPGVDFAKIFATFDPQRQQQRERKKDPTPDVSHASRLFGAISDAMVDGTVRAAEQWRPDLVIHSVLQGAGALVASKLGIPAVSHGIGLGIPAELASQLTEALRPAYERHGVTTAPQVTAALDVSPPSMRTTEPVGWPMRYVPFNGGGVLPDWLVARPQRPRIAVTLGTVVPNWVGLGPLRWIVDAAKGIDAQFVLAIGDADPTSLGDLPPNVRPAGWVPLGALLDSCAAVIHHGGAGSTLTAAHAGVPQLVLPAGADQFRNAEAVRTRGLGIVADPSTADATLVTSLLRDAGLRGAATDVQAEMAAMPSPADVVPKLVELAGADVRLPTGIAE